MPLYYKKYITRQNLRDNRDWLFVFGDNIQRKGYGGQAKCMRGEINSVGIPTKWKPSMSEDAFFDDTYLSIYKWTAHTSKDIQRLKDHHSEGGIIIWPYDGIGTGLAQLESRSPRIYEEIKMLEKELS